MGDHDARSIRADDAFRGVRVGCFVTPRAAIFRSSTSATKPLSANYAATLSGALSAPNASSASK